MNFCETNPTGLAGEYRMLRCGADPSHWSCAQSDGRWAMGGALSACNRLQAPPPAEVGAGLL